MSADLVNLRQFRKRKAREEEEKAAEANRVEFGRTKAEKKLTETMNRKERRSHDQKRLQPSPKSSGPDRQGPSGT